MADDAYTLPKDDPCHDTLEGYKKYMAPRVDDLIQVSYYRKNAEAIQEWLKCCPGGKKLADRFRPKFPDQARPSDVTYIPVPSLFNANIPCANVIYSQKGFFRIPAKGDMWLTDYRDERDAYWKQQYFTVANQLHDCCMYKLRAPKPLPESNQPTEQETESTRLMQALVAYEYQLASVKKERDEYRQRLQRQEAEHQAALARLTVERDTAVRNLRELLTNTAPVSGVEALAHFASGSVSPELLVFGVFALIAGFLLGAPGHTRERSKLVSGIRGALAALFVYLLCVAFLPDTQLPHFLLALAIAVLAVTLRALARSFLLLRKVSGPAPPSTVGG